MKKIKPNKLILLPIIALALLLLAVALRPMRVWCAKCCPIPKSPISGG